MFDFFIIFYIIPFIIVALVALFIFRRRLPSGHKEGEVKKCIYCGATIGANRKFCGKCGKKQPTYGVLKPVY